MQLVVSVMPRGQDEELTHIDANRLNDARWAACNVRHEDDGVPTMEKAAEMADRAVAAYLGIEWEEFDAASR